MGWERGVVVDIRSNLGQRADVLVVARTATTQLCRASTYSAVLREIGRDHLKKALESGQPLPFISRRAIRRDRFQITLNGNVSVCIVPSTGVVSEFIFILQCRSAGFEQEEQEASDLEESDPRLHAKRASGPHSPTFSLHQRKEKMTPLKDGITIRVRIGDRQFGSLFFSNPQEVKPEDVQVTFDDVRGMDEAKQEVEEIVSYLRDPEKYSRLGGRLPKGVLLVGPPGTGKTLLARAIAGEAQVPFFHTAGSEFDEVLVGQGARRVRDLFEKAKARRVCSPVLIFNSFSCLILVFHRAPCIIFIDEIDSVGSKRVSNSLHPYANQTINQLLSEMDGFNRNEVLMGPARTGGRIPDEEANRNTAYHEAGHTLVSLYTKHATPLHKVTIIPRGQSLGHTATLPEKDEYQMTKSQLLAALDVMMGGRVAEELIFGDDMVTTGAADDLRKASQLASQMVKVFGMSDKVGLRDFTAEDNSSTSLVKISDLSPQTAEAIDKEINQVLQDSYQRAKDILSKHKKEHQLLAEALLEYETLSAEEVRQVISGRKIKGQFIAF
ncbi:ATP-dependent metallopeptidase HflB [Necator americanus]|uniref:ATP-dependent metallopeptidase HflB n=1 Tax=Necator americanus TaxID=51031 RepID=W2SQK9_NECAM|nr:ATP-dependent metallopeptidase HflB [Necator americanus]ETN71161.1 ATP-dependent metallopeptidase HflB [Necator americanus]